MTLVGQARHADPAHAATPVVVSKSSSSVPAMRIVGSDGDESIRVGKLNGFFTVSNSGSARVRHGPTPSCSRHFPDLRGAWW